MADRITKSIESIVVIGLFQNTMSNFDLMWRGSNLITLLSGKERARLV
jgi:hypothetical protein